MRATQFCKWMHSVRRNMQAGIEAGVMLPKSLIRRLHEQLAYVNYRISALIANEPLRPRWHEDSFFGQTFGRR